MIKIAFDLECLIDKNKSGFGYYVEGLFSALQSQEDPDIKIIGILSKSKNQKNTLTRWIYDYYEYNNISSKLNVDILHKPCFSTPKSSKKVVITLHDIRALISNERMSYTAALYWKKWLPYSLKYADQIVTTSPHTKNDLIKYLGIDADKISIIPIGLSENYKNISHESSRLSELKNIYGINREYFISVGTIQPIKNYNFLLNVFKNIRIKYSHNFQLVIVGQRGWAYESLQKEMNRLDLIENEDVIITGYVNSEDKINLVKGAVVFLFPSIYEGFGLPPLESQALGVPVISTNTSSLPWVLGESAIYASPDNIEEWVNGFSKIMANKKFHIENGLKNIKRFEWNNIAKDWINLYKRMI